MENRKRGAFTYSTIGKIAAAMLCGAAFAGTSASANPSYTYKTVAANTNIITAGALSSVGLASINDAGQVAFYGAAWCGGTNSCAGVYTVAPAGVMTKIIDGGAGNVFPHQTFGDAIINQGGAVSFGVAAFTSAGPATSNWLDLWKNGLVQQIAPTRAINGTVIYTNPRLLNNGKVIFGASDTQSLMVAQKGKKPPQPVSPGYCSFLGTGSALNGYVATLGGTSGGACTLAGILLSKVPNGATQLRVANDGTHGNFNNVTVNQAATVAFSSRNLPGHPNSEGLFQQKTGASPLQLAQIDNSCANAPPPSGTCLYRGYTGSLATNAKGVVLANVVINTWTSGNPNSSNVTGVTLNGDIVNGQVAWPGMVIDGCTVATALVGPRSINKTGQIALLLNCLPSQGAPAHAAIVVATPAGK